MSLHLRHCLAIPVLLFASGAHSVRGQDSQPTDPPATPVVYPFDVLATADASTALQLDCLQEWVIDAEVAIRTSDLNSVASGSAEEQQEIADFWQFVEPLLLPWILTPEQSSQFDSMWMSDSSTPTPPPTTTTPPGTMTPVSPPAAPGI